MAETSEEWQLERLLSVLTSGRCDGRAGVNGLLGEVGLALLELFGIGLRRHRWFGQGSGRALTYSRMVSCRPVRWGSGRKPAVV